jgi:hypothetical protein
VFLIYFLFLFVIIEQLHNMRYKDWKIENKVKLKFATLEFQRFTLGREAST